MPQGVSYETGATTVQLLGVEPPPQMHGVQDLPASGVPRADHLHARPSSPYPEDKSHEKNGIAFLHLQQPAPRQPRRRLRRVALGRCCDNDCCTRRSDYPPPHSASPTRCRCWTPARLNATGYAARGRLQAVPFPYDPGYAIVRTWARSRDPATPTSSPSISSMWRRACARNAGRDAGERNSRARAGCLRGGQARAARLTPERRAEIARQAAATRWSVKKR